MNARLIISHLAAVLVGLALSYAPPFAGDHGVRRAFRSAEDPVAALTDAVRIEDAQARTQALLDFFATADPSWAERLRAEVNKPGSDLVLDEISETLFAAWWSGTDPEAAFKGLVQPTWANRQPWLREVMKAWVKTSPLSAIGAIDSLPPNPEAGKLEATRILIEHWWDESPDADPTPLLGLLYKLDIRTRAFALEQLISRSIEKRGIDATEKFVESVPVSDDLTVDMRQEIAGRYVQAMANHDIHRAVRWAEKNGQGRENIGVLRHLAFTWGYKDGPAAMEWAMHLPDPYQREDVTLRAWLSFRQVHPDAASAWLTAREPEPNLQEVYVRYLTGTARSDAPTALAIAERAKDQKLRERLLAAVGVGWMRSDPKAALAWLDTVELAPDLEQMVRETSRSDASEPQNPVPAS